MFLALIIYVPTENGFEERVGALLGITVPKMKFGVF